MSLDDILDCFAFSSCDCTQIFLGGAAVASGVTPRLAAARVLQFLNYLLWSEQTFGSESSTDSFGANTTTVLQAINLKLSVSILIPHDGGLQMKSVVFAMGRKAQARADLGRT